MKSVRVMGRTFFVATCATCPPSHMFYTGGDRLVVWPPDAGKVTAEFVERLVRAFEADT